MKVMQSGFIFIHTLEISSMYVCERKGWTPRQGYLLFEYLMYFITSNDAVSFVIILYTHVSFLS